MFGFMNALAAAAGAATMFLAMIAWDAAIDDPGVRREAREAYVKEADRERATAEREQAEKLAALIKAKALEMERELAIEAASKEEFAASLKAAYEDNQEKQDEIDRLKNSPDRARVPLVRDLDVRLRNR